MASDSKKLMAMMARAVAAFQASPEPLRVLCTLPNGRLGPEPRPPQQPVQRIVVLDSSFNPPTRAHGQMAMEALAAAAAAATEDDSEDQALDKEAAAAASRGEQEDRQPETCHEMPVRLRLLLLLAVRNADKAPAPASLPARLVMMEALARKLLSMAGPAAGLEIDVSVTTMPFIHDKALAVAESRFYGSAPPALLFAVGFDTLVRILDPRYYGRSRASASASAYGDDDASPAMQAALGRFFDRARLHVTTRPIDGDGTQQRAAVMQRLYELGGGAWAARVKVCDGATAEMAGVSSSRARETARAGPPASLDRLVDAEVRAVVLSEALYCEGAS